MNPSWVYSHSISLPHPNFSRIEFQSGSFDLLKQSLQIHSLEMKFPWCSPKTLYSTQTYLGPSYMLADLEMDILQPRVWVATRTSTFWKFSSHPNLQRVKHFLRSPLHKWVVLPLLPHLNQILFTLKHEFHGPPLVSVLLSRHYSKSETKATLTLDNPPSTKSAKVLHTSNAARPSKQKSKLSTVVVKVKPEHNKFVEEANALLPPQIPVWSYCMASIDQRVSTQGKLAYFVSEPALIIRPIDNARKLRYIQNWLLARDTWYHLITHSTFRQEPLHQ